LLINFFATERQCAKTSATATTSPSAAPTAWRTTTCASWSSRRARREPNPTSGRSLTGPARPTKSVKVIVIIIIFF
jgi:hypothetical protein